METTFLNNALSSQYKAALEMLRNAIQATPEELWDSEAHDNRTWRLAYHTLFYTKLYLSPSYEVFAVWDEAIEFAECLGGTWEDPNATVSVEGVHSADELVSFLESVLSELPESIAALPLEAESGFEWYPISRLELHLNNIRHIQHHTGQLIERLRANGVTGLAWVGGGDAAEW